MADLQTHKWTDWTGGIDDSNEKPGGYYFSIGVDPYRKPGYLRVADALSESVSNNSIATFTESIFWFQMVDGDLFGIDSGGDIWKRDASTGWTNDATWPHNDGNAGAGQGLIEFNDELFWAANTTVGRITTPTGTPGFTDSWQTGLTSADWHPMEKFIGKLCVGHGRDVATWDGTTWTATALRLPLGFITKSMAVIGDYLAIGTVAPAGEDSRVFFWDGTSASYNKEIHVKADAIDALFTWSNLLWVVAGNAANLHYFDGSGLQEVAKIADVDTQGGDSVTVRPSGIAQYQNQIALAVNTISTLGDRIMPGIWAYDPKTGGFRLLHLLHTRVMNASGHADACYMDGTNLWVAGRDTNTGASDSTFVDVTGGSKYTESCYLTTQWFEGSAPFADKHYRKLYLSLHEFPSSGANNEITVKFRLDDTTRRLNNGTEYTATAGTATTVTISSTTGIQIGDELTVTGGPSSGDIRRITAVTATVLTVDRAFTTTPVNAQTKFVVERWSELGVTDSSNDPNETLDDFWLSDQKSKKIQFKIELRDAETTGEMVAISDMSLTYIQKRPT